MFLVPLYLQIEFRLDRPGEVVDPGRQLGKHVNISDFDMAFARDSTALICVWGTRSVMHYKKWA